VLTGQLVHGWQERALAVVLKVPLAQAVHTASLVLVAGLPT
jgi:hypothetical protein